MDFSVEGSLIGTPKSVVNNQARKRPLVPISLLEELDSKDESFVLDILAKLRDDEVGLMCRNDYDSG